MRIDLDDQRVKVIKSLRSAMRANATSRGALLGVKGEALAKATLANRSVFESPKTPAIKRYTGVLYDAADLDSLDKPARVILDECVLIFSGLWGLVAPSDPIPDYKLKMGARLGSLGRLSSWWKPTLSTRLNEVADGRQVWNLLPQEHDAAWDRAGSGAGADGTSRQISVSFLEPSKSGSLVAVSHWNKFLKGALVRHLLENPSITPEDLTDWDHPSGFRLDLARTETEGGHSRLYFVKNA